MRLLFSLALIFALTGCRTVAPLPSYGSIPGFQLTDQGGRAFSGQALTGRVWVADFIFTTCGGICPRMTSQMRQVQDAFTGGNSIKLVSFTVDPAHDTPQVLAAYAREHRADARMWSFLTGPRQTLEMLDRNAFKLGNVDGSLTHSSRFVLVDRRSQIRGYYDTSDAGSIPRLITGIHLLLRESS